MKNLTIILFFLASISLKGQDKVKDTVDFVVSSQRGGFGPTIECGRGNYVTLIRWSDHPVKNVYDSGDLQIQGDTLRIIRVLAKRYDSLIARYYDLKALAEDVFQKEAAAVKGADYLEMFGKAMAKYRDFTEGRRRPTKKKTPKAK